MKILVTGGAGFIGSHLVDALVAKGDRVTVYDRFEPQVHGKRKPGYLNPEAEYVRGDMCDRQKFKKILKRVTRVFHEAAAVGVGQSMYQVQHYIEANTLGTAVLLDLLVNERTKVQKLVVASSMSLYGEGSYRCETCGILHPPLRGATQLRRGQWELACPHCRRRLSPRPTPEEKQLLPTSIYALSKRHQEEMPLLIGNTYKLPVVALRYFNVYGPRQSLSNPYTGVCAIFSSRIKNERPPLIYEDGLQSRDFVHVDDIVRANLLVMEKKEADYGVLNVGTGKATTILGIAKTLIRLYGETLKPEIVGKYRQGDIRHCFSDISKIKRLGFSPSVTLEKGLGDLVSWGKGIRAVDRTEEADRELVQRGLRIR